MPYMRLGKQMDRMYVLIVINSGRYVTGEMMYYQKCRCCGSFEQNIYDPKQNTPENCT